MTAAASFPLLLVGGGSRLALRLRAALPGARAVVRHRTGDEREIVVSDYRCIPAASFAGIVTVVNCVGTPAGDAALLQRVNVDVPVAAATAARAAGCRHFIQLSSLSVYGRVPAITAATPVAPVTAYGRSKAAAEAKLRALATPEFAVTILRVPALYGVGAAGKLGPLARAMDRVGFVAARTPAPRSLLHLDNAAAAIVSLAAEARPTGGIRLAADHDLFDLSMFAAAVAARRGRPVRLVRLPGWAGAIVRGIAPGFHASVLAPSVIAPPAAMTTTMALPLALADGIAAMLAGERRTG